MREQTYEIADEEEVKKLPQSEQKRWHKIPAEEAQGVQGMNRAQRRAWLKQHKKGKKQ